MLFSSSGRTLIAIRPSRSSVTLRAIRSVYDASDQFFAVNTMLLEVPLAGGVSMDWQFEIVPVRSFIAWCL